MKMHIKPTVFLVLIALFFSCGKDDDNVSINQNPEEFNVTASADIKGLGIQLNWDIPTDPDGDALTYDVMVGSALIAENITSPSHSFLASAYNTTQSGNVIAKDGKGGESSSAFTITSSSLVDIPDASFEDFLVNNNIDRDGQINGQMDYELPLEIVLLDFSAQFTKIKNLTGIEAFSNLEYLDCSFQHIVSLDLSRNTELDNLICSETNLLTLDLSNNVKLTSYTGAENRISSIDFSKNVALKKIDISDNPFITELDITQNIELLELNCEGASLSALDVSQNIELTGLNCSNTGLTTLDTSNNTKLKTLFCFSNAFTSIDLSNNLLLEHFICSFNNINILNLSQNSQLKILFCTDNNLTSLNLKNGTSQNMQQFNATNNPTLTSVCIDVLVPVSPILAGGVDTGVSFSTICN